MLQRFDTDCTEIQQNLFQIYYKSKTESNQIGMINLYEIIENLITYLMNYFTKLQLDAVAKPNVSPPGCATSRLRPATRIHYFS